jgi:hypothetical protein
MDMLRRILAWKYIVAVVVILGFSVYVSHEDQKTRDQYEQKCTPLNATAISLASHSEDCDIGADNAARHLPRWYRVFGWPEGITTWAILLTLLALAEQTSQTRIAAEATRDAAKAALLNAEAVISAERGRLMMQIEKKPLQGSPGKSIFVIKAANSGRSPVQLKTLGKPTEIATAFPKNLPVPPIYPKGPEPLDGSIMKVSGPPAVVFEFVPASPENVARKLEAHKAEGGDFAEQKVLVFGEILYFDGISKEERYVRYCLRFDNSVFSIIGGTVVADGPKEYNTGT